MVKYEIRSDRNYSTRMAKMNCIIGIQKQCSLDHSVSIRECWQVQLLQSSLSEFIVRYHQSSEFIITFQSSSSDFIIRVQSSSSDFRVYNQSSSSKLDSSSELFIRVQSSPEFIIRSHRQFKLNCSKMMHHDFSQFSFTQTVCHYGNIKHLWVWK